MIVAKLILTDKVDENGERIFISEAPRQMTKRELRRARKDYKKVQEFNEFLYRISHPWLHPDYHIWMTRKFNI